MQALRNAFSGGAKKGEEKVQLKKKNQYDKVTHVSIPKYMLTRTGHVDYVVEVRKGGTTWTVARRYTQFKKLHADLTALCPMTMPYHCEYGVIPVLCGSSWTEVTNQSPELIEKRRGYLEVYMEQLLVAHNKFYQARTALYSFLHDDEIPVNAKPGQTPLPGLGAGGGKIDGPVDNVKTDDKPSEEATRSPTRSPATNTLPVSKQGEKQSSDHGKSPDGSSGVAKPPQQATSSTSCETKESAVVPQASHAEMMDARLQAEGHVFSGSSNDPIEDRRGSAAHLQTDGSFESDVPAEAHKQDAAAGQEEAVAAKGTAQLQKQQPEATAEHQQQTDTDKGAEPQKDDGEKETTVSADPGALLCAQLPRTDEGISGSVELEASARSQGTAGGHELRGGIRETAFHQRGSEVDRLNSSYRTQSQHRSSNIPMGKGMGDEEHPDLMCSASIASVPGPSYFSLLSDMDNDVIGQDEAVDGAANAPKNTCQECGRTVLVHELAGGEETTQATTPDGMIQGGVPPMGLRQGASCASCRGKSTWNKPAQHPEAVGAPPQVSPKQQQLVVPSAVANADKDKREPVSSVASEFCRRPHWTDGGACNLCNGKFSFFLRKHHCRRCGKVFCGYCSAFTFRIPRLRYGHEVRVCKTCFDDLQDEPPTENKGTMPVDTSKSPPLSECSDTVHHAEMDEGSVNDMEENTDDHTDEGKEKEKEKQWRENAHKVLEEASDLKASDFELVTTLGRGTFGKVMKVRHTATGEMYAMKVLSKKVVHKRRMVEYIKEEKNILSRIDHPFIVPLYAAFQTDLHLYLVLEFLPGGELYSHIYSQGRFGEVDSRFYISEVILAVAHLHTNDIVHRDIKPENIVLDREGHAKLTDFGLAKANFSKHLRRSFVGSAEYLSPETLRGDPQTYAVDWWSVGVLLYEMLVGAAPFNGTNNNDVYQQIINKQLNFDSLKSETSRSVLRGFLTRDVGQRLKKFDDIRKHAFFAPMDWDLLLARKVKPPFVPDLSHNDTRYFSRDFTFEWATIEADQVAAGRATLDMLSSKFENFPHLNSGKSEDSPRPVPLHALAVSQAMATDPSDTDPTSPPTIPPPASVCLESFFGVWTLMSLELITATGQISYPWGSDVVGQAIYLKNGQFSLQITTTRASRSKFRDTDYKRVTREEMADAYLTYVGSFGVFTYEAGESHITHHSVGSLCPNWAEAEQKRYFQFVDASGKFDPEQLSLATGSIGVDGMNARTVMRFMRISEEEPVLPDFMQRRLRRQQQQNEETLRKQQQEEQQQAKECGQQTPSFLDPERK
ncbi:Protein kinase 2 [Diplonema papillatum]|nr:Protein kinase 2 [Diplonema papillatum]